MRTLVFEGSPAEIAETLKMLDVAKFETETPEPENSYPAKGWVSVDYARRFLSRDPALSDNQRKVLAMLYEAGDKGVHGTRLAELLGLKAAQFRGLMGALGRRLWMTQGGAGYGMFFAKVWNPGEGSYNYTLSEGAREAVRLELIED
jgi:hypothetical protein